MNKAELIAALAAKTGKPQTEVKQLLEAFTATVGDVLAKGDKITLVGFGTFDVQNVPGRTGRNPRTGEPLGHVSAVLMKAIHNVTNLFFNKLTKINCIRIGGCLTSPFALKGLKTTLNEFKYPLVFQVC